MKINQPVTDHEIIMEDGQTIVSKTDLKGSITYINQYFMDISGFTEEELIGKNHNLIRHPEMPSAAFQDLWEHMKASGSACDANTPEWKHCRIYVGAFQTNA